MFGFAITFGLLADRGIVHMPAARLDQIGVVSVIEFLYFITFYTARVSQRVTLDAVSQLEKAVRGVAQREALLVEARAELDRALKVGGPGRFTDQVIGSFRLGVLIGRGGMGEVYEAQSVKDLRRGRGEAVAPGHARRLDRGRAVRPRGRDRGEAGTVHTSCACSRSARPRASCRSWRWSGCAATTSRTSCAASAACRSPRRRSSPTTSRPGSRRRARPGSSTAISSRTTCSSPRTATGRRWKILDFGVSKQGGTGTLTKGHVVGTPAYMAPEQARGEDVDHRADVYSLAAILYRTVTGHPAFTGKDVPTTLYDVVYRVPTQPSMLADVPGDIDRVLAVGLAKHPRDRFVTAVELAAWFAAAARESLTAEQRQRADALAAQQPWGTRLPAAAILIQSRPRKDGTC